MLEKNAKMLRNGFLAFALLSFALGVIDVIMLGFDISFKTGLMTRMGFAPHSFLGAAHLSALLAIAFGIIELEQRK